jgi:hypothetical protein
MYIDDAQQDFRRAYVGGGPGVLVSGLVWLAAASAAQSQGIGCGFAVLFIGGMIIHPVSTVLCRTLFGRAKEATGNPLAGAALESTIAMIGGLVAAWLLIPLRAEYVFPVAAIAAGTRYAVFQDYLRRPSVLAVGRLDERSWPAGDLRRSPAALVPGICGWRD